jgi:hypothetical protein
LTSSKMTYVGLAGFGIEITSTELMDDRAGKKAMLDLATGHGTDV